MIEKPPTISIDNENIEACDERDLDPYCIYAHICHMNLSPFEAATLRDWLTQFLEWEEYEHEQYFGENKE